MQSHFLRLPTNNQIPNSIPSKLHNQTFKAMNSKIKCSFRNISLWALTSLLSVPTLLQAQTSYNYIQTITDQYWGNGTNWSPTSIPNGTDVVVNVGIASANPNCSNTAENQALSNSVPNFPYVFGRLNLTASTTIGVTAGSTTERLRQPYPRVRPSLIARRVPTCTAL